VRADVFYLYSSLWPNALILQQECKTLTEEAGVAWKLTVTEDILKTFCPCFPKRFVHFVAGAAQSRNRGGCSCSCFLGACHLSLGAFLATSLHHHSPETMRLLLFLKCDCTHSLCSRNSPKLLWMTMELLSQSGFSAILMFCFQSGEYFGMNIYSSYRQKKLSAWGAHALFSGGNSLKFFNAWVSQQSTVYRFVVFLIMLEDRPRRSTWFFAALSFFELVEVQAISELQG
jgi:hypothetical protein